MAYKRQISIITDTSQIPSSVGTSTVVYQRSPLLAASPLAQYIPQGTRWADCSPTASATPLASAYVQPQVCRLQSQGGVVWNEAVVGEATQPQARVAARPNWADVADTPVAAAQARPQAKWADLTDTPANSTVRAAPGRRESFHLSSKSATPNSSPCSSPPAPVYKEDDSEAEEEELQVVMQKSGKRYSFSNYCTTPHYRLPAPSPLHGKQPRIGIDIGGVLVRDGDPSFDRSSEWDLSAEAPGAIDAVQRIAQVFRPENVFLVSKVRPGGAMQQKIEHWLHEVWRFCKETGIPSDNIIFVSAKDGPDGKGVVASQLRLSHFVDDKIEVLHSVFSDPAGNSGHIVERFNGLLLHFAKGGCKRPAPQVAIQEMAPRMRKYYCPVANWTEVMEQLLRKLPACLKGGGREQPLQGPAVAVATTGPPQPVRPLEGWKAARAEQGVETAPHAPSLRGTPANSSRGFHPQGAQQQVPPAPRVESAPSCTQPALHSVAQGQRPRLVLKRRDSNLGPVGQVVTDLTASSAAPWQAKEREQPVAVALPVAVAQPPPPQSAAAAGAALVRAAMGLSPTSGPPPTAEPPRMMGPALVSDPAGGRPKLILKPRTLAR